MPFAIKPEAYVEGIIDFEIPSDVKMHRRETTKLEDELYDCVPHDLFNFLEENQQENMTSSSHVRWINRSSSVLYH